MGSLRVEWRTDTAAGIFWTISEDDALAVDHYELVVGNTEEQARSRTAGAVVFDATNTEHPELWRGSLPDTQRGDVVDHTVLRDLPPDSDVYARLEPSSARR